MKIVMLLSLFLFGCGNSPADIEEYKDQRKKEAEKEVKSFIYVKDSFGICYAMSRVGWNSQVTTTIPCEKVNL